MTDTELLSITDVAARLGIHRRTIDRVIVAGDLPSVRVGPYDEHRIAWSDVIDSFALRRIVNMRIKRGASGIDVWK